MELNLKKYNFISSVFVLFLQMSLNNIISLSVSNSVFTMTFLTGIFLSAIGLGVYLGYKIKKIVLFIKLNYFMLLFFSLVLFPLLIHYNNLLENYLFVLSILSSIFLGISSGIEFPLYHRYGVKSSDLLTIEYLGSSLGILVFVFILFPFFGLMNALYVAGLCFIFSYYYLYRL